jgi:hypothetical protein
VRSPFPSSGLSARHGNNAHNRFAVVISLNVSFGAPFPPAEAAGSAGDLDGLGGQGMIGDLFAASSSRQCLTRDTVGLWQR